MELYKIWVDDIRYPPNTDWIWVKSVNQAKTLIEILENTDSEMLISLDHDAGDYGPPDYIKVLDWLEETGRNYPIHIHSQNVVGRMNMEAICKKNGWTIVP